jgi:hypothetical protein
MRFSMMLFLLAAIVSAASPNLDRLLSHWKLVRMPFDAAGLSARERQLVEKLVEASRHLEEIFWLQSDPQGLKLLRGKSIDPRVRRLLEINGSRWDLIDGYRPFVGNEPHPPGGALYPPGLTREDIERYVKDHPGERAAIYSPYTVIRRKGGKLVAIPYRVEFNAQLELAARALRDAAALSDDPQFAQFLRKRSLALLTDDYYPSDLLWLDLKNPKFDVIFAPYETYLDGLLGVKTSYGAAVLIRDEAGSRKLEAFARYAADIQDALPLAPEDRPSKRGHVSPMEVVDAPFRAGDLRHGYQAVADNLPNDPRIHAEKGSKKIFFKNFLDARVENIVVPLAGYLMVKPQAALVTRDAYLTDTLLHEISHELGPAYARRDGKQVEINQAIGPQYSGLEEAKADVVGMFGLNWLREHGVLSDAEVKAGYAAHAADIFRMLRFGTEEAHAISEIMQFNYFRQQGAIVWRPRERRYEVDFARMPAAVASLAKELLEMEATGDRARAEAWFAKYRPLPPELGRALASASSLPVDIEPLFSFPDLP